MESWRLLAEWIDERTLRERIMLFAASAAVLLFLFYSFFEPLSQERQRLGEQLRQTDLRQQVTSAQISQIAGELAKDWAEPHRRRLKALEARRHEVVTQLASLAKTLVGAEAMGEVLRTLLSGFSHLQLISLKSLAVDELRLPEGSSGPAPSPLYRRGVELVVEGDYLALLAYVQALEEGPWRFLWGPVRFEVQEYPRTRLTLTLYTLSMERGWLTV